MIVEIGKYYGDVGTAGYILWQNVHFDYMEDYAEMRGVIRICLTSLKHFIDLINFSRKQNKP